MFLSHDRVTLAEHLRRRGYFTAGISGGTYTSSFQGVAQGFCYYRDPDGISTRADRMTGYAEALIGNHAGSPFFLFLNYFDPHFPYEAPDRFMEKYEMQERIRALKNFPDWKKGIEGSHPVLLDSLINHEEMVPQEVKDAFKAGYQAEVSFLDRELGRLFKTLKRHDLYDRSLIILVSDHGEFLGEQNFFFHGYRLDRELSEIPFLIKWPGQKVSRRVDRVVSLVDLFPTILHAAGLEYPDQDGILLAKDGPGGETERPFILMEEHSDRSIHYLKPDVRRIADHVYGRVSTDSVVILWPDGRRCYECRDARWIERPCEGTEAATVESVLKHFQIAGEKKPRLLETLTKKQLEELRALGYMP